MHVWIKSKRFLLSVCIILFIGITSIVFALNTAYPRNTQADELFKQLQAEEQIKIAFVDPLKYKKPQNVCANEVCLSLLGLIQNAEKSVDFAIYGIGGQDEIFNALVEAQKRGVIVRGVMDIDERYKNIYPDTFRLVSALKTVVLDFESTKLSTTECRKRLYKDGKNLPYEQVLEFDVDGKKISQTYISQYGIELQKGIMHNKFLVADEKYVWTGSTNVSSTCMTYNSNVVAVINSPIIADSYEREFEQMYVENKFHEAKKPLKHPSKIKVGSSLVSFYSTPNSNVFYDVLQPLINNAQETIDVPIYFLTHKWITQALINAHKKGVKVRIILDANGAASAYSKHEILRKSGVAVKIENFGGKMHEKSIIIDKKIVVLGSANFTSQAQYNSDENILIIEDTDLAEQYTKHFNYLYASIPKKWLKGQPNPESRDSKGSCADGIDNNHDGHIDKDDDGCKIFGKRKKKEYTHERFDSVDN